MEHPFDWLQNWYKSQCDGDWEHCYGIRIKTVDNPGWHIVINLSETECDGKTFSPIKYNIDDEIDWYYCKINDNNFEAGCGPYNLTKVLKIFSDWVKQCQE